MKSNFYVMIIIGVVSSANNVTQAGFVYMYDWSVVTKTNPKPSMSFAGDKPYARFGSSLMVSVCLPVDYSSSIFCIIFIF